MAGKPRTKNEREAVADSVFKLMETGIANSLRAACRAVEIAPSRILDWCDKDPKMAERYARANAFCINTLAAEILEIADTAVGFTDNGGTDSGAVQKQRLQIDSRKWLLSKIAPSKYGDRVALVGGGPEDHPVQHKVDVTLTPDDAYMRMIGK